MAQISDAPSFCVSSNYCGANDFDQYVVIFDLLEPVTARSILPVLSKSTTNHALFKGSPSSDVWFELSVLSDDNSSDVSLFKIQSTNKIASFDALIIKQVKLSLSHAPNASSNSTTKLKESDFSFCIDRLFVFEEYYLNTKVKTR